MRFTFWLRDPHHAALGGAGGGREKRHVGGGWGSRGAVLARSNERAAACLLPATGGVGGACRLPLAACRLPLAGDPKFPCLAEA